MLLVKLDSSSPDFVAFCCRCNIVVAAKGKLGVEGVRVCGRCDGMGCSLSACEPASQTMSHRAENLSLPHVTFTRCRQMSLPWQAEGKVEKGREGKVERVGDTSF